MHLTYFLLCFKHLTNPDIRNLVVLKNTLILHSETIDSDMKAISIRFKSIIGTAVVLTAAVFLTASCTGAHSGDKRARAGDKQVQTAAGQRTAYAVRHFWDSVNFSDHSLIGDTAFMEQNFANYIAMLSALPGDSLRPVIARFIEQASADTRATDMIAGMAAKYLYDYNSPMHDEDLFIAFAEAFVASPAIPEIAKTRTVYLLDLSLMNRPGAKANDFEYILTDGTRHHLSEPSECETLLMFFDIDCEVCAGVLDDMKASADLKAGIDSGKVRVLAIYVSPLNNDNGSDSERWRNYAAGNIPRNWNAGRPVSDIHDIYDLRVLPASYLLSPSATVLQKDL